MMTDITGFCGISYATAAHLFILLGYPAFIARLVPISTKIDMNTQIPVLRAWRRPDRHPTPVVRSH
ncbi:hypothetical protein L53_06910 [Hyphomonas sp. L-53-1-40]|nr:hypothetical protein L53_06910 [Hyphomonas sp. L-53-1-40]